MEKSDLEIIGEMRQRDPELQRYLEEHREFERRLEEFNRRPYLTAAETMERKRLQKLKLAGRDKIEQILAKYRQKEKALMKMTGAQILLKCLKREEVKHIFGYPGGVVLDIYDELTRHPEIKHILVRHEQAAVHAADGYARATGKVGVALVTSGPGATNTVTGHRHGLHGFHPHRGASPARCPPPSSATTPSRKWTSSGITRPCTKHNYLVKDVNDLAQTIHEAFHIARTGRPGPVLVDLPKDVIQASDRAQVSRRASRSRATTPPTTPIPRQVKRALEMISSAKQPVLYTGGGVILSDAAEELTQVRRDPADPGDQHPHGPGRLSRATTPCGWACWACTAPTAPTWRCPRPTCSSRSAPASTTGSPASWRNSPPTPRSSTSTSTPPPSART